MEPIRTAAEAIKSLGGPSKVARLRGVTPWAISKWTQSGVPAEQVLWLAEKTGFRYTPHQLAPALYPHRDDGLPELLRQHRCGSRKPQRAEAA